MATLTQQADLLRATVTRRVARLIASGSYDSEEADQTLGFVNMLAKMARIVEEANPTASSKLESIDLDSPDAMARALFTEMIGFDGWNLASEPTKDRWRRTANMARGLVIAEEERPRGLSAAARDRVASIVDAAQ